MELNDPSQLTDSSNVPYKKTRTDSTEESFYLGDFLS